MGDETVAGGTRRRVSGVARHRKLGWGRENRSGLKGLAGGRN